MGCQLFGLARIGRDAEVRYTAGGESVCNLSLAFNYGKRDDSGKRPTQWVEGVLWGKLGEALAQYLVKGQAVAVTLDDVHIETYNGRNGQGHKLVGRVSSIELAGSSAPAAPAPPPARQAPPARNAPAPRAPAPKSNTGFDDMDDDIPF